MAENKKNSIAGKVATPKTAPPPSSTTSSAAAAAVTPAAQQPVMDPLEALAKSIGAKVKLTAAGPQPQTYEGTLFTACPILNVVILNTRSSAAPPTPAVNGNAQAGDYHIIPVSRIQTFQITSPATGVESGGEASFANTLPPIGPVDVARLRQREQARIEKLKEEERNRGKGVTKEAQAIFDSFKRINMPIRWHNQEMIVHEAVIIAPPYQVENCKGAKDKQEVLNRVKKVLEGERRKLKEKEERERKAAAAANVRKGG